MPGFQLLPGQFSKLKEMIPWRVAGGTKGQAREEKYFRRTVVRRVLGHSFPQPLCPNSNPQHTQAELIATSLQYGAPWWILGQLLSRTKASQTLLAYQEASMASQLFQQEWDCPVIFPPLYPVFWSPVGMLTSSSSAVLWDAWVQNLSLPSLHNLECLLQWRPCRWLTTEESLDRAQKHKWLSQLLLAFSIQVVPLTYPARLCRKGQPL